jgi:hypothetical protein
MLGKEASFNKRDCVIRLANELQLDESVFSRVFEYAADEEVWLESETTQTFAKYLTQIEKVIEVVNIE